MEVKVEGSQSSVGLDGGGGVGGWEYGGEDVDDGDDGGGVGGGAQVTTLVPMH